MLMQMTDSGEFGTNIKGKKGDFQEQKLPEL
jgi:hypothetical protein